LVAEIHFMADESHPSINHENMQPAVDLSTSDGEAEASQKTLKSYPAPLGSKVGCEKLVVRCTTSIRLKYDGDDVEDFFRESKGLEDKNMPPAAQPARDPLADVFPHSSAILLPGEHPDVRIDVGDLLQNAEEWLATPNSNFGGRRPLDLIGTPDEHLLRETLRSVIYSGMA
jgi:hypothetical protein